MKRIIYTYQRLFTNNTHRHGALIHLITEDGSSGWGEIAPLPGFSKESLQDAIQDAIDNPSSPKYPSSQWALASAHLDLKDPLITKSIPVRILHSDKLKLGPLSLSKACAYLSTYSQSLSITVDMNQQWFLQDALMLAKQFPNITCFEEPLQPTEPCHKFPYPVSLDESLRQNLPLKYPNICTHVIKPSLSGYPLPSPKTGIQYILSSSYESEMGIYQIAKLAHRLKIPIIPMGLGTCHLFKKPLFKKETYINNGILYFPDQWEINKDLVKVVVDDTI